MSDQTKPEAPSEFAATDPASSTPVAPDDVAATAAPADDPATLARQRDEYYDLLLRKTAEFDNYRKRIDRERQELSTHAAADLLTELLPLVDDLERALGVAVDDPAAHAYREGVELIHKQLLDLLAKRGVTPIAALGQPFDPHFHQAIAREVNSDYPEGSVIAELRRGYMLGNRLLRAAMVKVATA